MATHPLVQAILLCDGAMKIGNKWSLQGIFNRIVSPSYPATHPNFFIYVNLVELIIRNGTSLRVEMRESSMEELESPSPPVFRGTMDFSVGGEAGTLVGPLGFDFAVPVEGAKFPRAGTYDLVLFAEDTLLGLWTLRAEVKKNE